MDNFQSHLEHAVSDRQSSIKSLPPPVLEKRNDLCEMLRTNLLISRGIANDLNPIQQQPY